MDWATFWLKYYMIARPRAATIRQHGYVRGAQGRNGPGFRLIDLALQGGGSHEAFTWGCWIASWKRRN